MAPPAATPDPARPDVATLAAFAAFVLFGGANGTAIAFVVRELPPFWAGFLRFIPAAWLFLGIALLTRRSFPRGRALLGAALYGFFAFFGTFSLIYWAFRSVQPGVAQLILSLTPLLTFLLAVAQRLERFRWPALLGALLSVAGIAWIFHERLSTAAPAAAWVALGLAALSAAQAAIVAKQFPRADVVTTNVVAMAVGGLLMLAASLVAGEARPLPQAAATWWASLYLIVGGSVIAFGLFLVVLQRWTASAAAYQWVLLPLVAVPLSAWLVGERVSGALLLGGVLVLGGVYLGAFWRPRRRPAVPPPPSP